jgi:hypothetical protein
MVRRERPRRCLTRSRPRWPSPYATTTRVGWDTGAVLVGVGSCCFRPLIGTSPVPRSVPQPVSCVPLYHPGRRDFPVRLKAKTFPRGAFPRPTQFKRWRASAACDLVCSSVSSGGCSPGFLGTESQPFAPDRTAFAQGPLCSRSVTSFCATTGPCADPRASHLPFSDCLMGDVLAACATHGWSRGPSRFWPALLSWSATSPTPAVRRVHLTSSSPTTSAFAFAIQVRLPASGTTTASRGVVDFGAADIP